MSAVTTTRNSAALGHGADAARPVGIGLVILAMMPLVIMPMASVFIFGLKEGPIHFWQVLAAPEALFRSS